jgi:hypothetical protein
VDGLANRVCGFAEIEIEHPMRVGDHGSGCLRANRAVVSRTALWVGNKLVTGQRC